MPASAGALINYILHYRTSLNPRTLKRRLIAIKQWHHSRNYPDPSDQELVQKVMLDVSVSYKRLRKQALPLEFEQFISIVSKLKHRGRFVDWRDNALLQICFFGGFRTNELVYMHCEHLHWVEEGVAIYLPPQKPNSKSQGEIRTLLYVNSVICPVRALEQWLRKSCITKGYVFRAVNNVDQISDRPLNQSVFNGIIKSIANSCRLKEWRRFTTRSLRSGLAISISKKIIIPPVSLMQQGWWQKLLNRVEQPKRENLFEQNAADIILKHMKK